VFSGILTLARLQFVKTVSIFHRRDSLAADHAVTQLSCERSAIVGLLASLKHNI
jgi:hypothetical protein